MNCLNKPSSNYTTPEELDAYNRRTAKMILDAVQEGAGHLYTSEEISWALQMTGDLPLQNNQY